MSRKKILVGIISILVLIPIGVSGYFIKSGDTPYGLWGANWKIELAKYGISDPRKLPVGLEVELNDGMLGATPTPTSSANRKYVESPDFYLYSPAVASDTTITLNTLKDIYGNILTMNDIGTLGYGRIDPDSSSISESITFSGITANSDGTYTLTGVKSALAKYPYTQTSGLKRSHSINAIFRLTNTAAFYDGFANKDNNEIVDGWWTFTSPTTSIFYTFPTVSSSAYTGLPTNNGQLATKYYVDTVGAGGFTSANVSTSYGVQVFGTSPETLGINASSTTGMGFDGNGALYQSIGNALEYTGNAIAVSTSTIASQIATSTPTAGMIPIASSTGKISDNWINFYNSNLYANFQAGENITKGDAVIIGRGSSNLSGTANYAGNAYGETIDYNTWEAQKYTTTAQAKYISKVSVMGNNNNLVTFDMLANPIAVSTGTVYWLVLKSVSGFNNNKVFLQIQTNGADKPSNVVVATSTKTSGGDSAAFGYFSNCDPVGGIARYSRTTNAGSTWTSADGCIGSGGTGATFFVYEKMTTSSMIYKANATNNDEFVNFIGFADENISANSFGKVNVDGIDNNQTGLSVGYPYYLTDTSGVVSTTNGTIKTTIGISVSSTAILIKHDNP